MIMTFIPSFPLLVTTTIPTSIPERREKVFFLTLPSHHQNRDIMRLQLNLILILDTPQVLARPRIRHLKPLLLLRILLRTSVLQLRHLLPNRRASLDLPLRIQHQHKHLPRRSRSRPILRRMLRIKRPIGIISPFIRVRRTTDHSVLVEGKQGFVGEDS